jgi:hypothetical protein
VSQTLGSAAEPVTAGWRTPRGDRHIAVEDVVYLLEGEGVQSGVSLDGVIYAAEWLAGVLGRDLPGPRLVWKAGPALS